MEERERNRVRERETERRASRRASTLRRSRSTRGATHLELCLRATLRDEALDERSAPGGVDRVVRLDSRFDGVVQRAPPRRVHRVDVAPSVDESDGAAQQRLDVARRRARLAERHERRVAGAVTRTRARRIFRDESEQLRRGLRRCELVSLRARPPQQLAQLVVVANLRAVAAWGGGGGVSPSLVRTARRAAGEHADADPIESKQRRTWKGSIALSSAMSGSAPCSMRMRAASMLPRDAAACSGVEPRSEFCAFTSAPALMRQRSASRAFQIAAMCSAVWPTRLQLFGDAPSSSSTCRCSALLSFARRSSRVSFTRTRSPLAAATSVLVAAPDPDPGGGGGAAAARPDGDALCATTFSKLRSWTRSRSAKCLLTGSCTASARSFVASSKRSSAASALASRKSAFPHTGRIARAMRASLREHAWEGAGGGASAAAKREAKRDRYETHHSARTNLSCKK